MTHQRTFSRIGATGESNSRCLQPCSVCGAKNQNSSAAARIGRWKHTGVVPVMYWRSRGLPARRRWLWLRHFAVPESVLSGHFRRQNFGPTPKLFYRNAQAAARGAICWAVKIAFTLPPPAQSFLQNSPWQCLCPMPITGRRRKPASRHFPSCVPKHAARGNRQCCGAVRDREAVRCRPLLPQCRRAATAAACDSNAQC